MLSLYFNDQFEKLYQTLERVFYFIGYPNTTKSVKKTRRSRVFLTHFSVTENFYYILRVLMCFATVRTGIFIPSCYPQKFLLTKIVHILLNNEFDRYFNFMKATGRENKAEQYCSPNIPNGAWHLIFQQESLVYNVNFNHSWTVVCFVLRKRIRLNRTY